MMSRPGAAIGVDSAPDAFRAVAVAGGEAIAFAEVPVIEGEISRQQAASRALQSIERQGVARPTRCVAVAPLSAVVTAVLELPPRGSGAPISQLAAAELSRGGEGGGLEVAVFPIRERAAGATEYLVTGAARDEIMALVEDLDGLSVEVIAVDAPACALSRACGGDDRLIVDVGRGALCMHAVRQGQPVLSRVIRCSAGRVTSEGIVDEIDRCASYLASYGAGNGIREIVLTGADGGSQSHSDLIAKEFDISVRVWGEDTELGPAFAGAFGAAGWRRSSEAAA